MIEERHLHIISFDIPYPANYGGVIDVFYKIKALCKNGVRIHLHCFEYGREQANELEKWCTSVHYYKRKMNKSLLLNSLPFIVASRQSETLVKNLLLDNHPILFEGLHACFYLDDKRFSERIKLVRTHNVEHDYYRALAQNERSLFKKIYFQKEADKLRAFENILNHANILLPISLKDAERFANTFHKVQFVAPFQSFTQVDILSGKGNYCVYHGNLAISENHLSAMYLINDVFSKLTIPLVIAGSKPKKALKKLIDKYSHIRLVENPSDEKMQTLIQNAQINVLPTVQPTGIKLKLILALFSGRHCIVNNKMIEGTGLEMLCSIADTAFEMQTKIMSTYNKPFTEEEKDKRKKVLLERFDSLKNSLILLEHISSAYQ